MFEGKERRYQLIQELRTTHALQAPEHSLQKEEADMIRRKQADQQEALHKVWNNNKSLVKGLII